MKLGVILASLAATAFLVGCQTTKEAKNLAKIGVSFSWSGTESCSSTSPAFQVAGVPAGTAKLVFEMTDLDVPTFNHGGGTVAYSGQAEIPAGAFSYTGPCPPSGSHDYRFDVSALSASGDTVLGRGSATRPFPPK